MTGKRGSGIASTAVPPRNDSREVIARPRSGRGNPVAPAVNWLPATSEPVPPFGMPRPTWHVYILSNRRRTVLYTGVTGDLIRRVWQQRRERSGFTSRYHVTQLVWYEVHRDPARAIRREKQIKAGPRRKKVALVEGLNPGWRDLWEEIATPLRGSQ